MINAYKWAPKGFATWMYERDKRPGMVKLRKNREYANEVAAKLIEEKRQELKDGTSRRDLLSLLGSCWVFFMQLWSWRDIWSLVKASSTMRPEWRLSEEEIIAQVR